MGGCVHGSRRVEGGVAVSVGTVTTTGIHLKMASDLRVGTKSTYPLDSHTPIYLSLSLYL